MYTYLVKIFKFLSGRLVFVLFVAYFVNDLHMLIQKVSPAIGLRFLQDPQFLGPPILDKWDTVIKVYKVVSFLGIALIFDILYRNGLAKFLHEEEQIEDSDVVVPPYPYDEDKFQIIVGLKHNRLNMKKVKKPKWIVIDDRGLYQNILITGTIGTGKTASAMYPFAKQLMFYKAYDPDMKPGMLILDVKGNFYKQTVEFAKEAGREDDIIIIELGGKYKYNPMHKPEMKALVLANRIKVILGLFSPKGATDGYWLDKAELLIAECIKLCRLYNDGYVTFAEINKLVNNRNYLINKITLLVEDQDIMTDEELDLFETCRDYFENEYSNLAENTLSVIQSVVTQMTQFFYTDPEVRDTFCAPIEQLTFLGFKDVVDKGKIVILKMNIAEYRNLAKTIAAYMKLDFQTEVMRRLIRAGANTSRPVCMISDEYQEFVTATDAEFYAQSREPKCVSIVATQSYTSLINTLKDRDLTRTVVQNLINKIWLRTDDSFTVEEAQKQLGKEDKEKASKSISESSGDVKKSRILGTLVSDKASISESVNITIVKEFIFDEQILTQTLDVFTGVCFLSDGAKIVEPTIVHLPPYFSDHIKNGIRSKKMIFNNKQSAKVPLEDSNSSVLNIVPKRYFIKERKKVTDLTTDTSGISSNALDFGTDLSTDIDVYTDTDTSMEATVHSTDIGTDIGTGIDTDIDTDNTAYDNIEFDTDINASLDLYQEDDEDDDYDEEAAMAEIAAFAGTDFGEMPLEVGAGLQEVESLSLTSLPKSEEEDEDIGEDSISTQEDDKL